MTPSKLSIFSSLLAIAIAPAYAAQVGQIYACYACQNTGNAAIDTALAANPGVASDGILFAFVNTSSFSITGGVFSETGSPNDSFALPTIAAGGTFILIPGVTSDGNAHPVSGLFAVTGVKDTSDGDGNVNDSTAWSFTASTNGQSATTGTFTAGQANLILPYRDNPANGSTSFIGFGPSGDVGCNNCYFGPIAAINTPTVVTGTPEPASVGLALAGAGLFGFLLRRRRSS